MFASRLVNVVRIVDRRPAVSEENDPAEAEDVSDVSDGELEDAREERDYDGEKEEREAVGDDEDEENSELNSMYITSQDVREFRI